MMKKWISLSFFLWLAASKSYGNANDSVFYEPDIQAAYKYGTRAMFTTLSRYSDSIGLHKFDFEMQEVKIYIVINDRGKVINVLNAGCHLDERVEKIIWQAFLTLKDFTPAIKNGQKVTSAKLYEFSVYPQTYFHAEYDVRVKVDDIAAPSDKDFTIFKSFYTKSVKQETAFPKNYKRDKLDGLVKVEFSFNKKGKPTNFKVIKSDKDEFVENALIALFCVKPISADYIEMIGPRGKFVASFDYVSLAQLDGFLPSNH